jgi:acetyltransferase-like isoleucine patch superfamily enzyme
VKKEKVVIEDDCWIASNSILLAGVTIGKGSVVAAGSVVTQDVPPYSVVAGVPARVIKNRRTVS